MINNKQWSDYVRSKNALIAQPHTGQAIQKDYSDVRVKKNKSFYMKSEFNFF